MHKVIWLPCETTHVYQIGISHRLCCHLWNSYYFNVVTVVQKRAPLLQ